MWAQSEAGAISGIDYGANSHIYFVYSLLYFLIFLFLYSCVIGKGKGKTIPLQAWTGP
jgi:hypothetical protein